MTVDMGDKYRLLVEYQEPMKEVGFRIPQRREIPIVEMDDVESIMERVDPRIAEAAAHFHDKPIIARSSGAGDALGIGIYESVFTTGAGLRDAVRAVLASFFTQDAVMFRRDFNLEDTFGVFIDEVVGQVLDENCYAPIFSGALYTTCNNGKARIVFDVGLDGVNSEKPFERRSSVERVAYTPNERYASSLHRALGRVTDWEAIKKGRPIIFYHTHLKYFNTEEGILQYGQVSPQAELTRLPFDKIISRLVEKIRPKIEQATGGPKYIEFAITHDPETVYWLTQIAELETTLDEQELGKDEDALVISTGNAGGSGKKICRNIVVGKNLDDVAEYNAHNRDHILVLLPGHIRTFGMQDPPLRYRHVSKASVILEAPSDMEEFKGTKLRYLANH